MQVPLLFYIFHNEPCYSAYSLLNKHIISIKVLLKSAYIDRGDELYVLENYRGVIPQQ